MRCRSSFLNKLVAIVFFTFINPVFLSSSYFTLLPFVISTTCNGYLNIDSNLLFPRARIYGLEKPNEWQIVRILTQLTTEGAPGPASWTMKRIISKFRKQEKQISLYRRLKEMSNNSILSSMFFGPTNQFVFFGRTNKKEIVNTVSKEQNLFQDHAMDGQPQIS